MFSGGLKVGVARGMAENRGSLMMSSYSANRGTIF